MEFNKNTGKVLLKDKEIREPVKLSECKDCTIENCSFRYDRTDTTLLSLGNCERCKIINCKFSDKSTKGLFVKIYGAKSKDNEITGCEFWNHTFNKENGGEPMRVGNSDVSGCNFNTKITKCLFHDLRSDVETISIKSCGNLVQDCDFENNDSMVTIRHGGYNTIQNNRFRGKGGIRDLGAGNIIKNNYFKDNQSTSRIPIQLEYGNTERDPNFTSQNQPSGKQGNSHAMYAQVRDGQVVDNKFENCKVTVKTVDKGRKYGPVNNKSENNNTVQPGELPEQPVEKPDPEDPPEPADEEEEKPDQATTSPEKVLERLEELNKIIDTLIAALRAKGIEVSGTTNQQQQG